MQTEKRTKKWTLRILCLALTLLLVTGLGFSVLAEDGVDDNASSGTEIVEQTQQNLVAQQQSTNVVLASFAALAEEVATQGFDVGAIDGTSGLVLPASLSAADADGNAVSVNGVSWGCAGFDAAVAGIYTFVPTLPAGYVLGDGASAPAITVVMRDETTAPRPTGGSIEPLSLTWTDTGTTTTTMTNRNQVRTLTIGLNKLVDTNTKYTLEITYVDPAGDTNANAFKLNQYDGNPVPSTLTDVITGPVTSTGSRNGRKLTYTDLTLTDAAAMNITFAAGDGAFAPGQELKVTATLKEQGGNGASTSTNATLTFEYQKTFYHMNARLYSPSYLKAGEGVTQVELYTGVDSGATSNPSNIDGRWPVIQKITFTDFGPITIRIGSTTKTYEHYINTYGAASPVLLYPVGVDISANPDAYIRPGTTYEYTAVDANTSLTSVFFQVKTNADFAVVGTVMPYIIFGDFKFTMEGTLGGKPISFTNATKTEFEKDTTPAGFYCFTAGSKITAVDGELTAKIGSVTNYSPGTVTYNSAQYQAAYAADTDNAHLYYQDLAKVQLVNYGSAAEDTQVTLSVPTGVTLTHLRLPSLANSATYTGISFLNGAGQTVTLTPNTANNAVLLVDLAAHGVTLQEGEGFTFTITGLEEISASGYSWYTGIILIGVTSENAAASVTFGVEASFVSAPAVESSSSTAVAVNQNNLLFTYNNLTPATKAVARGEAINVTFSTNPGGGPYNTNMRYGLEKPVGVQVDPVWYLSLPEGVGVEKIALENQSLTDIYGNPVTFRLGETFSGGTFGANGTLHEIYLVQDATKGGTEGGSVYLTGGTRLVLTLRVEADYEGNSIDFSSHSLLLGSRLKNSTQNTGGVVVAADKVSFTMPDASEIVSNSLNYIGIKTNSITVTTPQAIVVTSSAQTKGGYVSYVPGNAENTAPQLFTGETTRSYKTYIFNGLTQNYSNAKAYFVLPVNDDWGTGFSGAPTITTTTAAPFVVYYTTDSVTSANAALDASGNLLAGGTAVSWKTLVTGTGAGTYTPTEPTEGWDNITAVKYEFTTLASGEKLTMTAPFTVPGYDPSNNIVEGSVALGKTLHAFGGTIKEDDPTAAVRLAVASIKGRVYFDANANGGFDSATEAGLEDVVVKLYDASTGDPVGDASGYAVVNADGSYAILDLDDTPLTVVFEIPQSLYDAGYRFKTPAPADAEDDALTWGVAVTPGSVASENVTVGLVRRQAVVFDANGGNFSGEQTFNVVKNIGETVTAAEAATQQAALTAPTTDCTFAGWATKAADGTYTLYDFASGYTVEGEVTFYAQWQVGYTVRYVDVSLSPSDAGYEISSAAKTGTDGASITENFVLPVGYQKVSGQADTENITLGSTASDNVITFECVKKYTVSFDGNGGNGSMSDIMVAYGTSVSLPANSFARTGYSFEGWATSASGAMVYQDEASYTQSEANNVTLYAVWEAIPYTISYDYDGGTAPAPVNPTGYTVETLPVNIVNEPTKDGYDFAGWTGSNGATAALTVGLAAGDYGNKSYVANWTPADYTVSFDGNGADGGSTGDITVAYLTSAGLPANGYTRTSYSFEGWATSAGGAVEYADLASYTQTETDDVTLYAVWKLSVFTVRFEDGDGNLVKEEKVNSGDSATPPTPPERYGYIFMEWSGNYTNVQKDELVVAVYKRDTNILPETVTVTFDYNDGRGTYTSVTVSFGDGQNNGLGGSMPADPSGSSTFSGWNRSPDGNGAGFTAGTPVTGNITVYAQWGGSVSSGSTPSSSEASTGVININSSSNPPASESQAVATPNSTEQSGGLLTQITDGGIPLLGFEGGTFSLLNLVMSAIALVMALVMFARGFGKRNQAGEDEEFEEHADRNRWGLPRVFAVLSSLLPGVLFLLLENMQDSMVWINRNTPVIGLLFLLGVALAVIQAVHERKKQNNMDDGDEYDPQALGIKTK